MRYVAHENFFYICYMLISSILFTLFIHNGWSLQIGIGISDISGPVYKINNFISLDKEELIVGDSN